ncbi:MAG: MFS transporter, partial [Kiritimatiellae bacterium]|nr:MFS transporter [Kiritimatiellia bacterium]
THWFFAAVVSLLFPMAVGAVPPWAIFGFFGVMMVLHLLWAVFLVPETKGRRLEDIKL